MRRTFGEDRKEKVFMTVRLLPGCGKGGNREVTLHWAQPVDGFQDEKKNSTEITKIGVGSIQ